MTLDTSATALRSALLNSCAAEPVRLAYLFGSHARGTADTESDLDIAILASPDLTKEEHHALRFRLLGSLAKTLELPSEKIDVVVLQDVPTLLQYNVIHTGQLLFVRSELERLRYEFSVEQWYDDEAPFLERETDLIVSRILAHRS